MTAKLSMSQVTTSFLQPEPLPPAPIPNMCHHLGSVRLLAGDHDEPLGLSSIPRRSSASTLPTGIPWGFADPPVHEHGRGTRPKKTSSGMILDPQPEESANDPLNWPSWRRNFALGSVGLYCIVGGGLAPLLAAGFPAIAREVSCTAVGHQPAPFHLTD